MSRSALLLLALAWLLPGCSADPAPPATIQEWRQELERYVWEQGNGDPAVLADVSWDDVHPGFAVLADPLPNRSTDVYGLLLAHPQLEGHAYFVFLVAKVRNGVFEQMLPVALEIDEGSFRWVEGAGDEDQTRRYLQWRSLGPKAMGVQFPSRDDSFDVNVDGNTISITHEPSGARWQIEVPRNVTDPPC